MGRTRFRDKKPFFSIERRRFSAASAIFFMVEKLITYATIYESPLQKSEKRLKNKKIKRINMQKNTTRIDVRSQKGCKVFAKCTEAAVAGF